MVRFSKFTYNINIYDEFVGFLSKLSFQTSLERNFVYLIFILYLFKWTHSFTLDLGLGNLSKKALTMGSGDNSNI